MLQCLNDISQTGSIPKEHKNPSSKPLSRFWDEKQGCSYNLTLNTAGLREYLPKKTGIWIWGFTGGREECGEASMEAMTTMCWSASLPKDEAQLRGHTENDWPSSMF